MFIKPKRAEEVYAIKSELLTRLEVSRFKAAVSIENSSVKIRTVRLREKKDYCGQHPGPCVVTPFRERKHSRASYLEGADWVGFNRLLNDLCDDFGWECDIWSHSMEFKGKMRIRLGRLRRFRYEAEVVSDFGHQAWMPRGEDSDFIDRVGKSPPADEYPEDTPGLAEWRPEPANAG